MEKIHKNLNYANLMKTDWAKQFDELQIIEIKKGIRNNLDVSVYANPIFDNEQMYEIRDGLQDNLAISLYAKPDLTWKQMRDIKKFLLQEKNS